MDATTFKRIETIHPKIREELKALYTKANNKLGKGVRLRFAHTFRSFAEQDALYSQGRTTKGSIVTDAKGGQSIHNYGLAFDIVILYDKEGNGTFKEASWDVKRDGDKDGIADWAEVTAIFTTAGYTNGFIKNGKRWDLPHFQKDFGYTWKQLEAKVKKGDVIKEIINGVTYTYPKI